MTLEGINVRVRTFRYRSGDSRRWWVTGMDGWRCYEDAARAAFLAVIRARGWEGKGA